MGRGSSSGTAGAMARPDRSRSEEDVYLLRRVFFMVLPILLLVGCSRPYEVTDELREPIGEGSLRIGELEYELAGDYPPEKYPERRYLEDLREHLREEIAQEGLFTEVTLENVNADYEVRGYIKEFNDGSGYLRFPGLMRTGTVYLLVHLELRDTEGPVLFGGDFEQSVSSPYGVNEEIFRRVGESFARALAERMEE